jgi:hypothetical protein
MVLVSAHDWRREIKKEQEVKSENAVAQNNILRYRVINYFPTEEQ